MEQDIRWKQRFDNFSKAYTQLTEFVQQSSLNKFEMQGLIHCFEYTFELSWKTMKDYLEWQGFPVKTPRVAIQTAFQAGLVTEGHTWIDMLDKRNLMAHTYNEQSALQAEKLIRNTYYEAINKLHGKLEGEL